MNLRQLWESRMIEEVPDGEMKQAVVDEVLYELECLSDKDWELASLNNDDPTKYQYFSIRGKMYGEMAESLRKHLGARSYKKED